jgi:hypothetical protein
MQVISNSLDYTRQPGFVAGNVRNESCIVIVQLQNDQTTSPQVDFYMPRTYKHVKRVTLKRVDVPSTVTVFDRIMHFTKYDGSDLFPTVQRATTDNVTYKGFLVHAGDRDLNMVLANYRDSDGTFDQRMGLKQSDWVGAVTDYRCVLTFELELAVWQ